MNDLHYGIVLTLATGLVWGGVGVLYSRAAAQTAAFAAFMLISSLGFLLFAWCGNLPQEAPWREVGLVAAIMLPSGLAGQFGFLAMQRAMRYGHHGLGWSIGQAAMLCPFAAGIWLFGEAASATELGGMALLLASLPVLTLAQRSPGAAGAAADAGKFARWSLAAFALIGLQQVTSMIPGHCELGAAALSWRVPLVSVAGLVWLVPWLRQRRLEWRPVWRSGLLYALVVAVGQWMLFLSIDRMSLAQAGKAVYPLALGLCIVAVFLYCRIFRKEKSGWLGMAGVALVVGGMVLLALG